ncbi:M16 family metallopeptidase [Kitasatospora sp. NPDC059648]|uniref:M16 family metallopeptidase n=1 Tax=Kitasatospora sp. NPDC059648 TaxID=3346894 RepID=UPI0036C12B4B
MTQHEVHRLSPTTTAIAAVRPQDRITTLTFSVDFGSRDDPAGLSGAAHLLEHLLMTAPVAGGPSLTRRVEHLGGLVNAQTGLDSMVFQAQVLNEDAPAVLALMGEALVRPAFDDAVLDAERRVVFQELSAAAADPSDVVQDAFLERLFAPHPLGRPVGGTVHDIERTTAADLRAVHAELFARRRSALLGIGGLDGDAFRKAADASAFALAPAAPDHGQPSVAAALPLERLTGDTGPLRVPQDAFCWICIGGRAPALGDPAAPAYTVLAQLLGSSASSLLFQRLRDDEGLVYNFYAWSRGYTDTGAWRVLLGLESGNAARALDVVRELLDLLGTDGPAPDDLAAARRQAVMELVLDSEQPQHFSPRLATGTLWGTLPWSLDQAVAELDAVDAGAVRRAAAELGARLTWVVRPEAT